MKNAISKTKRKTIKHYQDAALFHAQRVRELQHRCDEYAAGVDDIIRMCSAAVLAIVLQVGHPVTLPADYLKARDDYKLLAEHLDSGDVVMHAEPITSKEEV